MTSQIFLFFGPLPCHIQNSRNLVPFVSFLGTPSPHPLQTSYKYAPLAHRQEARAVLPLQHGVHVIGHGQRHAQEPLAPQGVQLGGGEIEAVVDVPADQRISSDKLIYSAGQQTLSKVA